MQQHGDAEHAAEPFPATLLLSTAEIAVLHLRVSFLRSTGWARLQEAGSVTMLSFFAPASRAAANAFTTVP